MVECRVLERMSAQVRGVLIALFTFSTADLNGCSFGFAGPWARRGRRGRCAGCCWWWARGRWWRAGLQPPLHPSRGHAPWPWRRTLRPVPRGHARRHPWCSPWDAWGHPASPVVATPGYAWGDGPAGVWGSPALTTSRCHSHHPASGAHAWRRGWGARCRWQRHGRGLRAGPGPARLWRRVWAAAGGELHRRRRWQGGVRDALPWVGAGHGRRGLWGRR